MKKLIIFSLSLILLFAVVGCACGNQQTGPENRGTLTVAFDREKTGELLNYFQANQNVIVTGSLLNAETDYAALSQTAVVAVLKDAAVAEALLAAGWVDAGNWTEAQKQTNADMFGFTVLLAPNISDGSKTAAKYLTDWLVGDGVYDRTISTVSGGCSCKRVETTVTMKSDAPALAKSGRFDDLKN